MTDLPTPDTVRGQPLRAGLINLYRFDQEEFRFAGGRLLLRGNNGTGKTRALALLLPFLLDGEIRPARSAGKAVAVFNAVHHRHLVAEGAALADGARTAHGRYEHGQDKLHQARKNLALATTALAEVEVRLTALATEREQCAGEDRALRGSEAMRNADAIDRLRGEHRRASSEAARRREALAACTATAAGRQQEALLAQAAHAQATTTLQQEAATMAAAMHVLGIPVVDAEPGQQRSRVNEALTARRQAAGHLRLVDRERQTAILAATQAQQAAQAAELRRDNIQTQAEAAADQRTRVAASHAEAVRRYVAGLVELATVAPGFSLDDWLEDPEDADPLEAALIAAARERHGVLAGERAAARAQAQDLARQRHVLEDEATRLEHGADLPPPPLPWRNEAARVGRPGAPFWRLVDFRPEVDSDSRRGLEAALQAAGLLDAWVGPDGSITTGADGDAYLLPPAPLPGPALDRLLSPAIDPADAAAMTVSAERVAGLLASIGSVPDGGFVWVSADGRWRNGNLHGAWQKTAAAHLGAGARAAARRERLAAIALALTELTAQIAAVNETLALITAAAQRTDAEVANRPDPAPLRLAHRQAAALRRQLDEQRSQLAEAQALVAERRAAVAVRSEALATAAATAGLASWLTRLEELTEALHAGDTAVLRWWSAHTLDEERGRAARSANERAAAAAHDHASAQAQAVDSERQALGLGAELATQEATVGAAVGELLARLAALGTRLGNLARSEVALRETRYQQYQDQARADQVRSDAEESLVGLTELRIAALARLRQAASGGILAGLGESWRAPCAEDATDTAVVDLAALLAQATAEAPRGEDARDRLRTQVNERFQELHLALSARDLLPVAEHRQGIISVRVPFAGRERGTAELAQDLAAEVAQRRQLLTARERELVEKFLIDQAAEHLHDLLFAAETWVARVNQELAARPTSTGMLLRFRWSGIDDGPAGLEAVRGILLRPQVAWSATDRATLAEFLQQAIARERDTDTGTAWADSLAAALDYRRWHRFAVERQQHGRWVRLTRKTHGTGSGGEKALALTLPMFAAAAAHYAAAPTAPRLILLDEAFVGIDQDMRRQCMGLLATFDLDVVMTSEREWGCYDTVPALAICQLAADPWGGCVTLTRYVWNGRERRRDDG